MSGSSENGARSELYVVLSNEKSRRQSIGTFLRTASAFDATQVIVVGEPRFSTHGGHCAQNYVDIVHFYGYDEAREYLKQKGCMIYGIRVGESSNACHSVAYGTACAFVIDNEVAGLSDQQAAICDAFVHVPFHTTHLPHLALDTTVQMGIVLFHFTKAAGFSVRQFEETTSRGKFVIDSVKKTRSRQTQLARKDEVHAERQQKRHNAIDIVEEDGLAGVFG